MSRRNENRLIKLGRRFKRDAGGAVALIFALALIPVLVLVGAAVDYARAAKAKTQLQDALDAATLAAALKLGAGYTYADRQKAAEGALYANLSTSALDSVVVTVTDTTSASGPGISIQATGTLPTAAIRVVGIDTVDVAARAEAVAGAGQPVEIALVLDNTGSMVNDMVGLKWAATSFVNTVFTSQTGNLKMSVVPYVAAVNAGSDLNPAALDVNGLTSVNGNTFKHQWIAGISDCNPWVLDPPVVVDPNPPPPPPPVDPYGTPTGTDKQGALDAGKGGAPFWNMIPSQASARRFARSLFSLSQANAAGVTPNTVDPVMTTLYTVSPPYVAAPVIAEVPDGFSTTTICWLVNPSVISNSDLFNRIPGAAWKGCVEARSAPYDVTDDAPSAATVETLFTPYFAPDEPNQYGYSAPFDNSYLNDYHASWPTTGVPPGWRAADTFANLLKYDGVNIATMKETPPDTKGPNFACPDPLLRLTSTKDDVTNKINSLNYWSSGGTISSEGLMWGWRTLSPNAPFAQGAAYGGAKKFIVLMTDGVNSLVDNRAGGRLDTLSDYTAYGYLMKGRMGTSQNFGVAEQFLNDRMLTACTNAKAKGISIFTILFRETNTTTANLLKQCATTPLQALMANDATSLQAAFANVATQVNSLRLTK